jgi:hypothetical protein
VSIEIFDVNLDANYALLSVEAVLSVAPDDVIDVIDKTDGIDLSMGSGDITVPTLVPGCCLRITDLVELGLSRGDLDDATITFNDQTWKIYNSMPRPTPNGESRGELLLLLRKHNG